MAVPGAESGGGAGFSGANIFDSILGFIGGERTNSANAAIADKQMKFQERMSSTSYQRAVGDLRKAGLNPMLAYSNAGASTPQGASYQATDSVASAVAGAQKGLERKLIEAQIAKTMEDANASTKQAAKTEAEKEGIEIDNRVKEEFSGATAMENYWQLRQKGSETEERIKSIIKSVEQMQQQIETGRSSAAHNYADMKRLEKIVEQLHLDIRIKRPEAKLAEDAGEMGAAVKKYGSEVLDALRLLKGRLPTTINKTFNYGAKK